MPVSLKMQVVSGKGSLGSLMLIIWSLDQQHQYLGVVGGVEPQPQPDLLNQNLHFHKFPSNSYVH